MDSFVSGAIKGVVSMTLPYPLDVIKTRQQSSEQSNIPSFAQVASDVYNEHGTIGFFGGWGTHALQHAVAVSVNDFVIALLTQKLGRELVMENNVACNVVAGACAATCTTPLNVATTSQQAGVQGNLISVLAGVFMQEGPFGLFRGWTPSLILAVNPVITNIVSVNVKRHVFGDVNAALTAVQRAILGGIAKLIATIITYPLILAKVRAAVGHQKYPAFSTAFITVWKEEGIRGMYAGMGLTIVKSVLTTALLFGVEVPVVNFVRKAMAQYREHAVKKREQAKDKTTSDKTREVMT